MKDADDLQHFAGHVGISYQPPDADGKVAWSISVSGTIIARSGVHSIHWLHYLKQVTDHAISFEIGNYKEGK